MANQGPGPAPSFTSFISTLSGPGNSSVTLVFKTGEGEGEAEVRHKYPRSLLSFISPVFESMLSSDRYIEGAESEARCEFTPQTFEKYVRYSLLCFVGDYHPSRLNSGSLVSDYLSGSPTVSREIVNELLPVSAYYQTGHLIEYFMLWIDSNCTLQLLLFCEGLSLHRVWSEHALQAVCNEVCIWRETTDETLLQPTRSHGERVCPLHEDTEFRFSFQVQVEKKNQTPAAARHQSLRARDFAYQEVFSRMDGPMDAEPARPVMFGFGRQACSCPAQSKIIRKAKAYKSVFKAECEAALAKLSADTLLQVLKAMAGRGVKLG